ncbi:hypothetical protein MY5147_009173 [Beauveria neobassiana]|uniref:Coiled-coil domain-containing protein 174 n=2 Tax=Beauveria bassiana TaxID=176275 RepID=A0A0A2VTS2_BEABA|nr:hypothetical protein BBAD15_g4918 [Beauveria bassiana D1-5]PQK13786.1 hypothetical protein BB8028_0004g07170 [Beauveria bassiana]
MPQDPHLYGQRPKKKQRKDAALSSSLDFTAQLTSLMASSGASSGTATTTTGRARPSKEPKEDLFRAHAARKREKAQSRRSAKDEKLILKDVAGTEDESRELARARRNMENKARLYAAMKRGDYVPQDNEATPLIDFDRKWAEHEEGKEAFSDLSSSDDQEDGDDGHDEVIEYEDEFGRLRRGTRAEKERMERRIQRGLLGAEELSRMSARPAAPSNLIHGDAIQAMAFNPDDPDKMEALARKRDRSATPPEMKHYDADKEVRSKGVGFYKFSRDEDTRQREMRALEDERKQTETQRQAREEQKAARKREIEERRKAMEARRAKKQADSFLGSLGD